MSSRVGPPPPFFVPKGGFVRMTSAFGSCAPSGAERVAEDDVPLDVVEHRVHQREALHVGHELDAVEGLAPLEVLLRDGRS